MLYVIATSQHLSLPFLDSGFFLNKLSILADFIINHTGEGGDHLNKALAYVRLSTDFVTSRPSSAWRKPLEMREDVIEGSVLESVMNLTFGWLMRITRFYRKQRPEQRLQSLLGLVPGAHLCLGQLPNGF